MVNDVEERDPQQTTYCILQQNLFCALNQPGLVIPRAVVQRAQLAGEDLVITFIRRDHFDQGAKNARLLPAQTAVEDLLAFTKVNAALLRRSQQCNQFSRGARARMRPVIEMGRGERFEYPHESGILLFPPLNEEFSIAELRPSDCVAIDQDSLCACPIPIFAPFCSVDE